MPTDDQKKNHVFNAAATINESKEYWDSQSVVYEKNLKAYSAQQRGLEEAIRFSNTADSIINLYEKTHRRMEVVQKKNLPDSVKTELINTMLDLRDKALNRIKQTPPVADYSPDLK